MGEKMALITGASSGIGEQLARIHAQHGGDLVVVARRQEKLEALKTELEKAHGITVHVLAKDLTEPDAAQAIHEELRSRGVAVDYLINDAGFGYRGLFHEQDWARNEAMIKLNILALTALTRVFVPEMIARGSGRILNVASMGGFVPGPLQAVYYASKAFVISFSEGIANELAGTGITVTALCPGPTESEFTRSAQMRDVRLTSMMSSAHKIAAAGYAAMLKGKTVVVPGLLNKITVHGLLRISPRRLTTRISRALMEKR
ncbi:MAG: short-chain dehydrogenase [Planctomycetes bacterium RBG_13_62_9]|nr:MAG: short-chain dehydrogenase [Planctomycetes bacterium RBG_13_62_9]